MKNINYTDNIYGDRGRIRILDGLAQKITATALMEVRHITVKNSSEKSLHPILKNISFPVFEHEIILITGPSGSGKSMLLRVMAGLTLPDKGFVLLGIGKASVVGKDRNLILHNRIGYVPQLIGNDITRHYRNRTVFEVLEDIAGKQKTENSIYGILEILKRLNLSVKRHFPVKDLSASELQRFLIAAAVISHPAILLLDEPSSLQKGKDKEYIFDFIKDAVSRGLCGSIILTGNPDGSPIDSIDKIIRLEDGEIVGFECSGDLIGSEFYSFIAAETMMEGEHIGDAVRFLCPNCDTELEADNDTCPGCGVKIDWSV